jgi:4-hydroxybutyryl-CoA dehydratase / vinylacetyl-CoA-Delta-isomerase
MMMTGADFRDSLRSLTPRVFVKGERVENIADDPRLRPGINAVALTYDYALEARYAAIGTATAHTSGATVNRFLHINTSSEDLLAKLEYTRLVCQETGCAMRYLSQDGLNAVYQASYRLDQDFATEYHARFLNYLHDVQARDLTIGIAMTDAKGDRSLRPHQQPNKNAYLHVVERRVDGIVISGTKAIVTSAPYVHELLIMPGRAMTEADSDFALCCAVPLDAPGVTIVARPAGRPGESACAPFSAMYGQSTGACIFDKVFVPWDKVFLCGEWQHAELLTKTYAAHHRHTCIGARAGFGDLLIGAGALMIEANGLDANKGSLRENMVELIKIVEGFYACGIAASTYGVTDGSGAIEPEAVYANIGKLLLATQIYDMHRIAHQVSGGLVVTLPSPEEDHNPETAADLAAVLQASPNVPYQRRAHVARFIEDLTASNSAGWMSVISLHGGGSPEAMKGEIHKRYPIHEKRELVERLLDRGVLARDGVPVSDAAQPGQCCDTGCTPPDVDAAQ